MEKILERAADGVFGRNHALYFYHQHVDRVMHQTTYQFFSFNLKRREIISRDTYLKQRWGRAAEVAVTLYGYETALNLSSAYLSDGSVVLHYYQDRLFYKVDRQGRIIWKTDKFFDVDTVYAIAVQGDSLWCALPTSHTIRRYSLSTFDFEENIGTGNLGDNSGDLFCYPEDVYFGNGVLYVSDMGNQRVCVIHPDTGEIHDLLRVNEPVWTFFLLDDNAYIGLSSGYYRI